MSDTPRTDAYVKSKPTPERWEIISFAEELEQENAALRARVKRLEEAVDTLSARIPCGECETEGPGVPCKACSTAQAAAFKAKEDKQ